MSLDTNITIAREHSKRVWDIFKRARHTCREGYSSIDGASGQHLSNIKTDTPGSPGMYLLKGLESEGIAYTIHWQERGQGVLQHLRFSPEGVPQVKIVQPADSLIDIRRLTDITDHIKDPRIQYEKLIMLINETTESLKPMSWKNQVLNGRIYKTKRLIKNKNEPDTLSGNDRLKVNSLMGAHAHRFYP